MRSIYAFEGWQAIQLLRLQETIQLGGQKTPRFSLVDERGMSTSDPEKASAIFDMLYGKTFLPQTDAEWVDQLMTRYRISAQWDPKYDGGCWRCWIPHDHWELFGKGPTPGVAMVRALIGHVSSGFPLEKVDYPEI